MKRNALSTLFLRRLNRRLKRKSKRKTGYTKVFRRRSGFYGKLKAEKKIRIEIVSPVMSEAFGAYITEDNVKKLHLLLAAPQASVVVERIFFRKTSAYYTFDSDNWKGFPVIVLLGHSRYPFIVDNATFHDTGKRKSMSAWLRTIDNMSYLEAVALKKKLQQPSTITITKPTKKR